MALPGARSFGLLFVATAALASVFSVRPESIPGRLGRQPDRPAGGDRQMILGLLALALGIRVFIGAVQLARQAHPDPPARRPARSATAATRIKDES